VYAQNAFLAYQGFIIDPLDENDPQNTQYFSNVGAGRFNHEYAYLTEGANNKFTVNFGTQIKDNFFFGINLNAHTIDYLQSTLLYESNSNSGGTVTQVGFENNLSVAGSGFSAQLGTIAKLNENIRVGLSLESPTWYEIAEETTQYLESRRTVGNQSVVQIVDPRVLNVYENYYLRTPAKVSASAAYIFGAKGLLSVDYSFKDYASIQFDDTNYDSYFSSVNANIDNSLKGVSSIRLGGEYRIQQVSLRGGFQFEESPYQNTATMGDLTGFSLGMGYNYGNYSLDLSYARAEQKRKQQLYSAGLTDKASINTISSAIAFTLGFKF
jgi:long-subunit fatty acid transport protein